MSQNVIAQAFKSLFIDIIGEIVYMPIWWYTSGLLRILRLVFGSIKNTGRNLALGLMFKNIFKPMFGQYDKQGRIISFFMRLILTLSRLILFILISVFYILLIFFWIVLPILVVWGILSNFSSLWRR